MFSQTDVPNTMPAGTVENFAFVASSTASLLSFDFRDDPGYLYVTDITVNPAVSAVPEPRTVVGFGMSALIVAGYFGWRRRKVSRVCLALA